MRKISYVLAVVVLITLVITSTVYSQENAVNNNADNSDSKTDVGIINPPMPTAEELIKIAAEKGGKSAPDPVPLDTRIAAAIKPLDPPMPTAEELEKIATIKDGKSAPDPVPLDKRIAIPIDDLTPQDYVSTSVRDAVDNTALTWYTGGSSTWFGQTPVNYYGGDSAKSGVITHNQNTYMYTTTTLPTPQTLTFRWTVSSEANWDYLEFYIDGILMNRISGAVGWQRNGYALAAGTHTLYWRYIKDGSVNAGADAGYVDEVELPTLPNAVENYELGLFTSGSPVGGEDIPSIWCGQTSAYYYGGDSAKSGLITHNQNTYMYNTQELYFPQVLTFWWAVSSEANWDYLQFYIDGELKDEISGAVGWQKKRYALAAGEHTLIWRYIKDGSVSVGADAGYVDWVQLPSLDEAVDLLGLDLTTGGNSIWFGTDSAYYLGGASAKSDIITHNQNTYMYTTKTLAYPKTLSFWWAVSSEANWDYLEFYIDGVFMDRISGGFTWQKKSYALAAGTHTLYWRYIKDSSVNVGADAGYVDYVRIV